MGGFGKSPVIHDCIIKPEASGKIIGFKAISFQNSDCNVAAQTTLADDINRLTCFKRSLL